MSTLPALRPSMPPEKVAIVNGHEIHYYEAGSGPTVILLHGLGASGEIWVSNIQALATKFRVIAPDQIGFVRSSKPQLDYGAEVFADFLYAFLQALEIERASLVGNSMGGWIATAVAAQHPDVVDRLVLVDSSGLTPQFPNLNPASAAEMRELLRLMFSNPALITDELAEMALQRRRQFDDFYTVERTMQAFYSQRQSVESGLPLVKAPTLILWGRNDRLCPLADGERFHQLIPGSQLIVLDYCGHYPQLEKPAQFNTALLRFLAH